MISPDPRPTVALYHHLPPGGAERALIELTRHTANDIRYVLFETRLDHRDPFSERDRSELHELVDEVHHVRARSGGAGRLGRWGVTVPGMLRAERRIAAMIDELQPDALVVHHQRFTQASSVLLHTRVPSAYFVQEPRRRSFEYDLMDHPGSPVARLAGLPIRAIERWARSLDIRATRSADLLFCNSDHSREYIWRAYGRDATVVRLGVDLDRFVVPESTARDRVVLSVGGLDPTKGHELVVEAVAHMTDDERPEVRIITNRPDETVAAQLHQLARSAGVTLRIDTDLAENELVAAYQRAAAVVLAARVEPLGLVSLEAAACGTPAVAVREGGYRETVIDRVTGALTDRTATALAAGIAQVIGRDWDRRVLRAHVEQHHSWSTAAATYLAGIAGLAAR